MARFFPSVAPALLLSAALSLVVAGCGPDQNITPGCAAGNRAQCVVDSSMGAHFGCALLTDHTVWCWGRNDESQLGYPTVDLCNEDIGGGQTRSVACHSFPARVQGLERASAVASGGAFSCALIDDGSVRCWGASAAGQLGNGGMLPSEHPVSPMGLTNATQIALGGRHACALVDGGVRCWGANDHGQLGAMTQSQCGPMGSTFACSTTPVAVPGMTGVLEIAAGEQHTCGRTSDSRVVCWGDNSEGQLGTGTASEMPPTMRLPVRTASQTLSSVRTLVAGAFHTCALREPGTVWCWGRADHGELGNEVPTSTPMGCTDACAPFAVPVQGLPNAPAPMNVFDAGSDGGMDASMDDASADDVVDMDAAIETEGGATEGGVDAGVVDTGRPRDAMMAPPMGPQAISAGDSFSCAVLADTTLRCWGRDDVGQLGDGVPSNEPQIAAMVIATPGAASTNPLQSVSDVTSGRAASCARLMDGSLRCWGFNQDGALGTGNSNQPLGPVPVGW
jgi:alpha-tubulin suppressor-like RCC1 family protein